MEIVEQDTQDSEEIPNLLEFLLPNGTLPDNCSMFGVNYNKKIFNGWVKQPSACCGAASVAGAWNCLSGLHRNDPLAVQHNNVLDVYREMFAGIIETKTSSFERKLGSSIALFIEILNYRLEIYGKEIGGKKGFGATKKLVVLIIKQLVSEHYELKSKQDQRDGNSKCDDDALDADGVSAYRSRTAVECFAELLELEGCDLRAESALLRSELELINAEQKSEAKVDGAIGESDYEVSVCVAIAT